jgi:hypothetical protein
LLFRNFIFYLFSLQLQIKLTQYIEATKKWNMAISFDLFIFHHYRSNIIGSYTIQ